MEELNKQPLIDSLIDTKEILMLKAAVPYLHENQQKKCAMAIRFIEFAKTLALFEEDIFAQELQTCSADTNHDRFCNILRAIKDYCTAEEKEQIDTLIQVLEV